MSQFQSYAQLNSINDDYYWGNYFDLKVIIMKENGYINATRLYKDNNKRFDNWLRRESSKQLLNEISKKENISKDLILIKNMKGANDTRGTYVHTGLMFSIVSWISPKHARK